MVDPDEFIPNRFSNTSWVACKWKGGWDGVKITGSGRGERQNEKGWRKEQNRERQNEKQENTCLIQKTCFSRPVSGCRVIQKFKMSLCHCVFHISVSLSYINALLYTSSNERWLIVLV
jgi:hypothetical protein